MENENKQETLRVAFYIRVSTEEQTEKYGLDLQKEALSALMKSKGAFSDGRPVMILAGEQYVYIDDISGTTPIDERSGFARLKEDILMASEHNKPFDAVAVYKIDRFARKLKVLFDIVDFFRENDLQFISANESIDTSSPFGRAILGILGVISELELENIKLRTQGGRMEAIKKGIVMGPAVPYGYNKGEDKRLKVFETEAETVRMIFNMFINGKKSPYEIAKYLSDHDYPSPHASAINHGKNIGGINKKNPANFWRMERVRDILSNERYTGVYYYDKTKGGKLRPRSEWKQSPVNIPVIIDSLTFEKARILLENRKHQRKGNGTKHTYLLSGLLRCDCCYDPNRDEVRAYWAGERKRIESGNVVYSYQCGNKKSGKTTVGCRSLPLPAGEIEKYIVNFTKKLLANPIAVYNHQKELRSSKAELKELEKKREGLSRLLNTIPSRIERLREQHTLNIIDSPKLKKEISEQKVKEDQYKKEISEIDHRISQNVLSQGYIESLSLFSKKYKKTLERITNDREEVYDLIHSLIEEIIVYSRPVKDDDVIAGKKKTDQQIPYRIHIKLKLPQDILQDIVGGSGQESLSGAAGGNRTPDASLFRGQFGLSHLPLREPGASAGLSLGSPASLYTCLRAIA